MKIFIMAMVVVLVSGGIFAVPSVLTINQNVAVSGYDVVAYWTQGKPVRGSSNVSAEYGGATYHFSSEEHRELFLSDPERYTPQYGGYCAFAVSLDYLAPIQPRQWVIQDDRLYLLYNSRILRDFLADMRSMIESADRYWPGLKEDLEKAVISQ